MKKKHLYLLIALALVIIIPIIAQFKIKNISYSSWIDMFNGMLIYGMLAISLNLLIGNSGQISIGHAAFYAIGAYSSAIFMMHLSFPFFIAILSAAMLTGVVGFIIGNAGIKA